MKKVLLGLVILGLATTCYADVYLIINSQTKDVYTASEKNDTIIPEGHELIILQGKLSDYPEPLTNYQYKNKKFILNQEKVDKENKHKEEEAENQIIQEQIKKMAIEKLKADGKELKYH